MPHDPDPPTIPLETVPDTTEPAQGDIDDDGTPEARYEVRGSLGAGGMGEVSLCFDRRAGREVARKIAILGGDQASPLRRRFLQEARIQAQLEHPSIVPVYDLGLDRTGAPYFTMRHVRGVTLKRVLEGLAAGDADVERKFTRRRLLSAFASVCLAVHYAHSHAVIHRDLKPTNIMLDEYGELYVLDWGVARATGGVKTPSHPRLSRPGDVIGTPGYIAPEQVAGDAVDARADVYSLGTILFEILALEPLHQRDRAPALLGTLAQVDARPSARAPHREIPPELDAVCMKATALRPEARYVSARALHDAVDDYLEGDRDTERRREAAVGHAAVAQKLARAAFETEDPDAEVAARARAVNEVSRALALDPDNARAREVLVWLFTQPPRALPPRAREEMERRWHAQRARAAQVGSYLFLAWFPAAPAIALATNIHHGKWFIFVQGVAFLWAAVMLRHAARMPFGQKRSPYLTFFATSSAIATLSSGLGSLFLVPGLAIANAIAFLVQPDFLESPVRRRVAIVASSCATFMVPLFLDWSGITPAAYVFQNGQLIVTDRWFEQTPSQLGILIVIAIFSVVGLSMVFARFRDALTDAEMKLSLQAWQLQQLVPAGATSSPGPLGASARPPRAI
jgi:hypothetical protein